MGLYPSLGPCLEHWQNSIFLIFMAFSLHEVNINKRGVFGTRIKMDFFLNSVLSFLWHFSCEIGRVFRVK